jgi:two-component system, cell cycle sensor histidine kinase and response regulator CckA
MTNGWKSNPLMPVIEGLGVGLILVDADLKIRAWSQWFVRHSDLKNEDVVGADLLNRFPTLRKPAIRRSLETCRTKGRPAILSPLLHPNLFPLQVDRGRDSIPMVQRVRILPLEQDPGTTPGIALIVEDMTDSVLLSKELARISALLQGLRKVGRHFLSASDMQGLADLVCGVLVEEVGYAGARLRLSANDVQWRAQAGCLPLLNDDELPPAEPMEPAATRFPILLDDQETGLLEVQTATRALGQEERDLLAAMASDVGLALRTFRERALRREAEAALAQESKRLATMLQSIGDGVIATNAHGDVTLMNNIAEQLTGWSLDEAMGRPLTDVFVIRNEDTGEPVENPVTKVIREGRIVGLANHTELVKRDGSAVSIADSGAPIINEVGEIEGAILVFQNATERNLMQEQLLQSQKIESVGKLAGGVAHDFNNLLTVILASCSFVTAALRDGDPVLDDVLQIEAAGKRAVGLTRQLLAFSRRQTMRPVELNLSELLKNLDRMLGRLIGEDIELTTLHDRRVAPIMADPGLIEQAVMNLVVNARDAMPDGGKLTIEIANVELDREYARSHVDVESGPYVMLAVSDSGVGMDAETRARAFEPFFSTKPKDKGTGLGLSTVHGIVKQSHGSVWIYSEVGKGTTIKMYLPRSVAASRPTTAAHPKPGATTQGTENVLVVEDEAAVRHLTQRMLKKLGYNVLLARDGVDAQSIANEHDETIHLLLTDVVMPGPSGRITADKLLEHRPEMKVLFMSGYTDNAIVHHGVLDPGTHFLEKPFTINSLSHAVRAALNDPESNGAPIPDPPKLSDPTGG